jgi:hypothetical protein
MHHAAHDPIVDGVWKFGGQQIMIAKANRMNAAIKLE